MDEKIGQAEFDALVRKYMNEHNARLEERAKIALMFFDKSQLLWVKKPGVLEPDLQVKI